MTASDPESGIVSGTGTFTGIKSNQSYTVKNGSGLTATCSVTVTAQTQYRSSTCSTYSSCANAACGCATYNTCAVAACGNKTCQHANCGYDPCLTGVDTCKGGYNSCVHSSCGCKTYNSCAHSSCGVASYKSCATAACGNKTCRHANCGVESYKTCQHANCGWDSCLTTQEVSNTTCSWSGKDTYPYSCSGTYTSGSNKCDDLSAPTYNGQTGTVCSGQVYCKQSNGNYCWASNSACKCANSNRNVRKTVCTASCTTSTTTVCVGGNKTCTNSACGVALYKSCANAACGYNSCANSECGVASYNSCPNSSCSCAAYNSCQNSSCSWNSCLTGSYTCVGGNKTCANAACGYNSCANSACGCKTNKSCRVEACGCETWGSWSGWSTTACSASGNSKKCESRTVYN